MGEIWLNLLREHSFDVVSGAALLVCGWWFGRWRTSKQWSRQDFLSRLQISLTIIQEGRLVIRTLGEKPCIDVFGNAEAARAIADAARRTPPDDPILDLPRESYWSYLNSLVNELSALTAGGFIAADLGADVRRGAYLACLTCERAADVRTRKVRALVVRKDVLTGLPETVAALERQQDSIRWQTLRVLAAAYPSTPWRFAEVELVA